MSATKHRTPITITRFATSCRMAAICFFALSATVFANENDSKDQPEPGRRIPGQLQRGEVPSIAPSQGVPSKDDQQFDNRFRKPVTLLGAEGAPPQPTPGFAVENTPEILQQRMQELVRQQQELARQIEAAVEAQQKGPRGMGPTSPVPTADAIRLRGFGPSSGEFNPPVGPMMRPGDAEKQDLLRQLQAATAQLNASAAAQEQLKLNQPLPPDATLRAFTLKYVRPQDLAQALHNITGGGGARIAIDDRTNVLLLAGTDKQMVVAEQLVKTLDQPGKSQIEKAPQTLQLRIVWLLDGLGTNEGKEPTDVISAQVMDALDQLGFGSSRVVCHQLTTLTLQDNKRGMFQFEVPVIIGGKSWQFRGRGNVNSTYGDRYTIDFDLSVIQPNSPQSSQLSGSIFTPLGHYTVMGTDKAPEYPAKAIQAEKKDH
jgi:hypothetical protein